MKSSSVTGFAPENASLIVAAEDFSGLWHALESTPAHQAILQEALRYPQDQLLEARRRTGMRWTPTRWSAWLGKRLVVARADGATGVCIRPGILLRAAVPVLIWIGRLEKADDVYRMGDLVVAWRDGFLVASSSARYVRAATADSAKTLNVFGDSDTIVLERSDDPACRLTLRLNETLTLDGWVGVELTKRQAPLALAGTWPEAPILQIAGSSAKEVVTVVGDLMPDFPGLDLVKRAFKELEDELPNGWARGQDEFSLALLSVDTTEFLAVPEIALAIQGEQDLLPIGTPREAVRYEWAGLSGWMRPWLGEKLSLCAVTTRSFRLFTSQERTMARTLGRLEERPPVAADLAAMLDLTQAAGVAAVLARRAAENELLGHQNVGDVDERLLPLLRAIGELGSLRLEGESVDGGVRIRVALEPVENVNESPEAGS